MTTCEEVIITTKWCLSQEYSTDLNLEKQCDAPNLQKNEEISYHHLSKCRHLTKFKIQFLA